MRIRLVVAMFSGQDNYRSMFESRMSAGAAEKWPETKATVKPHAATISSWSYDMEGHEKKCVERYCELANKTTQQLYEFATPCMDDHQFEEENESVGELSIVCQNCSEMSFFLARIGRPDILWSVNKTCLCGNEMDKSLWQTFGSISYITHVNTGNIVMWETQHNNARLGLCQDSDFAGDLEDS